MPILKDTAPAPKSSVMQREAALFGSLSSNLYTEIKNHLKDNKAAIATETLAATVVGAGMAAMTKNPELLGKSLGPAVKAIVPLIGRAGIGLTTLDWGAKIGLPAYDVMQNPNHLEASKKQLAKNVGSGIVDYTAMGFGGLTGAGLAWKATPELLPKAPAMDLHPSLKLGEIPKEVAHPERFVTQQEHEIKPDVVKLYEASFPKEERQPTEEVADLVKRGRILVHTTRDEAGKLESFSFVSLHDESATKFAGLDFVATQEEARSSGVGSLHLRRLTESLKTDRPNLVAMTLEMEHPHEPGLKPEEQAIRARRSKFYDRLDAPNTNVKYNIIDFEDPTYRGMAQHRAFVFQPDKFNATKAAHTFMTDEGGYQLGRRDPAVLEFNRHNGVWEPPSSWKIGAVSPSIVDSFKFLTEKVYR
jgi:hypothetical protein